MAVLTDQVTNMDKIKNIVVGSYGKLVVNFGEFHQ